LSSGHYEPSPYSGPSASVISSSVTSEEFIATLQLSNATTWINNGALNIDSSNAGVIWALGTSPPSDPSDPDSDFQQHQVMGIFSINMEEAQVNSDGSSSTSPTATGTGTGTTSEPSVVGPVLPKITGNVPETGIHLTHRDKVHSLSSSHHVGNGIDFGR
jgi:Cytochrome domain of cellobiose dehydrogenase